MDIKEDFCQVIRLSLQGQPEDVRLYAARLVRNYKKEDIDLSKKIEALLENTPARSSQMLRRDSVSSFGTNQSIPIDAETNLTLLRLYEQKPNTVSPILSHSIQHKLEQLVHERKNQKVLEHNGLEPTKTAIFTGPPGVGKSISAAWVASQLNLPLYILDLASVMSSLLGKSGINLRTALEFAKRTPCVILLDEIDSIAKSRADDSDVGELKRLVTVILQEVDGWPSSGLLLAATNHPEIIDHALWRRFDLTIEFQYPDEHELSHALKIFSGNTYSLLESMIPALAIAFKGKSLSHVQKEILKLRRGIALETSDLNQLLHDIIITNLDGKDKMGRKEFALAAIKEAGLSENMVAKLTGLHRATIKKYCDESIKQTSTF